MQETISSHRIAISRAFSAIWKWSLSSLTISRCFLENTSQSHKCKYLSLSTAKIFSSFLPFSLSPFLIIIIIYPTLSLSTRISIIHSNLNTQFSYCKALFHFATGKQSAPLLRSLYWQKVRRYKERVLYNTCDSPKSWSVIGKFFSWVQY